MSSIKFTEFLDKEGTSDVTHRVVAPLHLMLGHSVGGAVSPREAGAGGDGAGATQGLGAHLHIWPGRHHPGQGDT